MSYISRPVLRRPRADWGDDIIGPLNVTVHEPSDEPQWTGLYDAQGNELYRVRDRQPIGFRTKI